ncbi:glycoside hydrolase family 10 protein [Robertkochia aurantiaca]|uniref:glycoside hydrolase family 10 protein n=1 Tax=Robertkochia aurantiaca TaxID=2873700 RepID=UPI001CD010C5|nr:family 10 glycosylhydrolase [Robertkochia sp. 3YJGBD-33]
MKHLLFISTLVALCTSCGSLSEKSPKREMRAVWIATVVNIDWPKEGGDPISKKKKDFIEILDFYEEMNFNTAIVQIRTAGDAFYPTQKAPWSRYLTGKEGEASADYDVLLEWMIEETHDRGMEFHAWLNPYRATFNLDTASLAKNHDLNKHPEWMIKYGTKYYYNPGLPEVQQHLTDITAELVERYDLDAIHFDDYFYPYKIAGETFNDTKSFKKYSYEDQSVEDWRRANVDSLIKKTHQVIKARKPWVQFGISPFGVWRNNDKDPKGSDSKAGQTNYDDLYADPMSWLRNGWIDYLAPQLYWTLDHPLASHRKLLNWWNENTENVNLYIGNGAYRALTDKDEAWHNEKELVDQLQLARSADRVNGNAYFSAKSLMADREPVAELLRKAYQFKALPPALPGEKNTSLTGVQISRFNQDEEQLFVYMKGQQHPLKNLVIYDLKKARAQQAEKASRIKAVIPVSQQEGIDFFRIDKSDLPSQKVMIYSIIDRFGNESELRTLGL